MEERGVHPLDPKEGKKAPSAASKTVKMHNNVDDMMICMCKHMDGWVDSMHA